jgi:hypothetical protein
MRLESPRVLNALLALIEDDRRTRMGGPLIAPELRTEAMFRYLDKAFGRNWDEIPAGFKPDANPDLATEIIIARERHQILTNIIREAGPDASPKMLTMAQEAADLVRRLIGTQNEVRPGGDKSADFRIDFTLAEPPGETVSAAPVGPTLPLPDPQDALSEEPKPVDKLEGFA